MKNFALLLLSFTFNRFCTNIYVFVIPLWVFKQQHGSLTDLALLQFVAELSRFVVTPVCGYLVDKFNRSFIMATCSGLVSLLTLVVAFLLSMDLLRVWNLFAINFVLYALGHVHSVAGMASIPLIVAKEKLTYSLGINEVV
jgi:MFS family permease